MKQFETMKYDVTGGIVKIWLPHQEETESPFCYQPFDPATAISFTSEEAAEAWALEEIKNRLGINEVN